MLPAAGTLQGFGRVRSTVGDVRKAGLSVDGTPWWGWHVPTALEAGVVLALGVSMMGIAIWEFTISE